MPVLGAVVVCLVVVEIWRPAASGVHFSTPTSVGLGSRRGILAVMADITPVGAVPGMDRVLECAADLLRPRVYWVRDPILDLEDAVFSCWNFQIDVPVALYSGNRGHLNRISVTVEDVRTSSGFATCQRISKRAAWEYGVHRYGPGRLRPPGGGWSWPSTEYSFDWSENGDVFSVLVGDLARSVLTWSLNTRGLAYGQITRAVPDRTSWHLMEAIDSWRRYYYFRVPEGVSFRPDVAFDHYRTLPVFMRALEAVLAFDSHVPSPVVHEPGRPLSFDPPERVDTDPKVRADLSVFPLPLLPSMSVPGGGQPAGSASAEPCRDEAADASVDSEAPSAVSPWSPIGLLDLDESIDPAADRGSGSPPDLSGREPEDG